MSKTWAEKRDEVADMYQAEGCIRGQQIIVNARTRWAKIDFQTGADWAKLEVLKELVPVVKLIKEISDNPFSCNPEIIADEALALFDKIKNEGKQDE